MRPSDDRRPASEPAPRADAGDDRRAPGAGSDEQRGPGAGDERPVPGAGGVVFDARGHVLILHHLDDDWVFPKGHVEPGETPLQAALREVAEEAGVTATCDAPERTFTTTYRNASGVLREITWFVCRTQDSAPTLTEDLFPEGEFLPPAEAHQRLTFGADRELFTRVLDALERDGEGRP